MRIAITLSGGVDSTFAALLLKEAGHDLIGVHLDLFPSSRNLEPLYQTAKFLEIPLQIIDLKDYFQKTIIQPYRASYLAGETPNPCVRCNALIKFGALWDLLKPYKIEGLASGHYARLRKDRDSGLWKLLKGQDPKKDQSYYLHRLSQSQMGHLLFPLGAWKKEDVRREVLAQNIPIAFPEESQEVCFIGKEGYRVYLEKHAGEGLSGEGDIVNLEGRVIGRHKGIHRYTIGQRQGMGIPGPEPYYVTGIRKDKNQIVLGPKRSLFRDHLLTRDFHWIIPPPSSGEIRAEVKLRYRNPGCPARLIWRDPKEVEIFLDQPQAAITPGQAAVAYVGEEMLGGGWIV